ncbi:gamma-butyrobetaine hydroxylase-like domain-containing protein [Aequoribacter sp.]|uniref:gamma-butyrobetaine hydroxylase-like domain-containing protein n=1 Tax=Aequoribacter sp. TaxID=2847771 RepID=UPI003F698208
MTQTPTLTDIKVKRKSGLVSLSFDSGELFDLSFEFLRVHSPSAEVKGHGPGQEVLQIGKKNVQIRGLSPIGHYALQIEFDDGHDSGLYSFSYLYQLATQQETLWSRYLRALEEAGASRDPDVQVIRLGN